MKGDGYVTYTFLRGAASIAEFQQTIIALAVCFGNFLSDLEVCPACRRVS